jgi:hypothetical protein
MIEVPYCFEPIDGDEAEYPCGTNPRAEYLSQTRAQRVAWEANRRAIGLPVLAPSLRSWGDFPEPALVPRRIIASAQRHS